MDQIPNPFLTGNEVPFNALSSAKTISGATKPEFLLMTPPPSIGCNNFTRHINTSNFNNSTSNNSSFPPWGSPSRFQNCRMPSPRNQSRGNYYGNSYSQRFNHRHQSSYQSPDNRNYSPSFQQSTPAGNCYGQDRNQSWRNNSPHKHSYQSSHKTPLKEIPIEKFISRNIIENPWNDFEEIICSSNSKVSNDDTTQSAVSSLLQSSSLAETHTNLSSDPISLLHVNNSVITNTDSCKSISGSEHIVVNIEEKNEIVNKSENLPII